MEVDIAINMSGWAVQYVTTGRSAEEMGYNLIRMCNMSGHITFSVRDYHRVEMLPGCITPLPEIPSAESQYMILWEGILILAPINNCQRHCWTPVVFVRAGWWHVYQHLSSIICYQNTISGLCTQSSPFFTDNSVRPNEKKDLCFKVRT